MRYNISFLCRQYVCKEIFFHVFSHQVHFILLIKSVFCILGLQHVPETENLLGLSYHNMCSHNTHAPLALMTSRDDAFKLLLCVIFTCKLVLKEG